MIERLDDLAVVWSGSLLRATWQGGLLIAVAWLLVRCRPGLPPRVACWIEADRHPVLGHSAAVAAAR
jgi:hypothetical protein